MFLRNQKAFYICTRNKGNLLSTQGEMAEWSIAAVLKTVEGNTSGGSNPSFSAERPVNTLFTGFFISGGIIRGIRRVILAFHFPGILNIVEDECCRFITIFFQLQIKVMELLTCC